ncbi:TPA: threonine--tRNA ligase [bacterium]|nr:threonine--tRNA ligase [bacterium]
MGFINIKEDERLSVLNHSAAHVLAQAIKRIYPQAKFWVGPVITEGFYYDVDLGDTVISEEDLPAIEQEMRKISKDGKYIVRKELTKNEALEMFKEDEYKIDLINSFNEDEIITCYAQGEFIDLCRGPHVESVKEVKHFKLLKVSGAYYKGDANNKMLQRVYGISFETKEDLDKHLYLLEEAKKRDHRKLGKELDIFMINEYGPGFPFFLNNGMIIRRELENFWYEEHIKEGYEFINTPVMLDKKLWEISGHWENYRENMYTSEIDKREFAIKPMNCPGGLLVYKSKLYSYRDLPLRVGELGHVHRHEASGALNGLLRVRTFTQDDAHLFMRRDQIKSELTNLINFIDRFYQVFGLTFDIELSTRPLEKYIGDIEVWDESEAILKEVCEESGIKYIINEGDGAFYGPKLDFHIKDSLGRSWQCGTIQLDMFMPERFDLTYVEEDGSKQRPIMLHRVIYGSIERFMGILIEHFAGAFPVWLAPVQVVVNPVNTEKHLEYASSIYKKLMDKGIRVKLDDRNEKLGYRTREARMKKIPLQIVVGDNEMNENMVNLKVLGEEKTIPMSIEELINYVEKLIKEKSLF